MANSICHCRSYSASMFHGHIPRPSQHFFFSAECLRDHFKIFCLLFFDQNYYNILLQCIVAHQFYRVDVFVSPEASPKLQPSLRWSRHEHNFEEFRGIVLCGDRFLDENSTAKSDNSICNVLPHLSSLCFSISQFCRLVEFIVSLSPHHEHFQKEYVNRKKALGYRINYETHARVKRNIMALNTSAHHESNEPKEIASMMLSAVVRGSKFFKYFLPLVVKALKISHHSRNCPYYLVMRRISHFSSPMTLYHC